MSRGANVDWKALVAEAQAARLNAYAPYSKYHVGAAVLSASGRIYRGCNVENASYGLTICAERTALAQMVAAGERDLVAIAVVTEGPEPGPPCGLCRQMMAEFASDELPIALATPHGSSPLSTTTLGELFPRPFRKDLVVP